jgi:hypothetical protein
MAYLRQGPAIIQAQRPSPRAWLDVLPGGQHMQDSMQGLIQFGGDDARGD